MLNNHKISVIIPAYNEEDAIGKVVGDIPGEIVDRIIVVDNGSDDQTAKNAGDAGAEVVQEPIMGYGMACLSGIAALDADTDVVVFIDGDYSDYPQDMIDLLRPVINNEADMTLGSRIIGEKTKGAMLLHSSVGNIVATFLIRIIWGFRYTDLGPFRAIRYESLLRLGMQDTNFGWTAEMQIKAITNHLRIVELPVRYRKRIGKSKITGTLSGSLKASVKIAYTIFKYM